MLFTQAGTLPLVLDAPAPDAPEDAGLAAFSAACAGRCPGSSATAAAAIVERLMNCLRFMGSSFFLGSALWVLGYMLTNLLS
jgi:hypothetical protein